MSRSECSEGRQSQSRTNPNEHEQFSSVQWAALLQTGHLVNPTPIDDCTIKLIKSTFFFFFKFTTHLCFSEEKKFKK